MRCSARFASPSRAAALLVVALAYSVYPLAQAAPNAKYEFGDLQALEKAFTDLADKVRPSVVALRGYRTKIVDGAASAVKIPTGQGSGFIIDSAGYIATNRHVVDEADSVIVTLINGDTHEGRILQTDVRSDLAVIKIDAQQLTAVHWADMSAVKVNQWAFASGNPFGLANADGKPSISYGVISALGREITEQLQSDPNIQYYGNLIEIAANINPGGSGGPLFNLNGEIIGIVTAIKVGTGTRDGCGFAIPMDRGIRHILDTLKTGKQVEYGFLGVTVEDLDPPMSTRVVESTQSRGAKIVRVEPADGPGGKAGLKPEDIVVQFNGVPIQSKDQLVRLVGFTPVGTETEVVFVRHGVRRTASVTLGDRAKLLGWAQK